MSVTAVDTSILFASLIPSADGHARAWEFLDARATNPDFVIPELCLVELYGLLRVEVRAHACQLAPHGPRTSCGRS